jgi:hypothetical protein
VDHTISHGVIITSFPPVRLGIQWCGGHQDRNIKFAATVSLQEASSTSVTPTNSEGAQVPVRYIGEQHVKEDLGRVPTVQDWLLQIRPVCWMYGQRLEGGHSKA